MRNPPKGGLGGPPLLRPKAAACLQIADKPFGQVRVEGAAAWFDGPWIENAGSCWDQIGLTGCPNGHPRAGETKLVSAAGCQMPLGNWRLAGDHWQRSKAEWG